jgi:chorismate-pyruvate lyase
MASPNTIDRPEDASVDSVGMLRIDLQESLKQSAVDPRRLSSFQRILLTMDGTVTEILEAQVWESIRIVKLFQKFLETDRAIPYLEIEPLAQVLVRKVILRGKWSHQNYIYAESILVPERLPESLRDGLLNTKKPIGQLMLEARTETFREILSCGLEAAGELGDYFDIEPAANLVSRTYRVIAERKPIMLITEKFPEAAFKD